MQFRTATAGLVLMLALAPATVFAQGTGAAGTGGTATPQAAASAGTTQAGDAEATHDQRTLSLGALSLLSSRIALEKAKDDDVKEFARFEVAEQETIAAVLKGMREPETTAAAGSASLKPPSPSDADVEAMLDSSGKEQVEKLRAAKAGDAFDKAYLKGQLQAHQQLLQTQEDYLKTGRDRGHRTVAMLAAGQIREHMALLKDIGEDDKD